MTIVVVNLCVLLAVVVVVVNGVQQTIDRAGVLPSDDPAGSWLTYAMAQVPGVMLQSFYAEAFVPAYPTVSGGSAAFWIGVEDQATKNSPGSCVCDLRQPIMIKHEFGGYSTFVERYDWYTGDDYQSRAIVVKPGQKVFGALQLQPNGRDYKMVAGIVNATRSSQIVSHVIQTDPMAGVSSIAWIVLEHQPLWCTQLPSSGSITFDNISAVWVGNLTAPFSAHVHQPACGSKTTILSPTAVQMNWNTQ